MYCENLAIPTEVTDITTIRNMLLARIKYHAATAKIGPHHAYAAIERNALTSFARELGWDQYLPSRPI